MLNKLSFFSKGRLSIFSHSIAASLMLLMMTGCACTDNRRPEANKDNNDKNKEVADAGLMSSTQDTSVQQAVAEVKAFKGDKITGKVTFTRMSGGGIKIVADIKGLTPGKHGFHVHEYGDCQGDGTAAGAHFNPTNSSHGGPDSAERHVGDLGNLIANEEGHAHYERVDKIIALEGTNSIIGRSIIIHADPDDYTTQPSGNSGTKIACGIIEAITQR